MSNIRELVIRAIRESSLSQNEISRRTGINISLLNRTLHRTANLSFESLEELLKVLGFELVLRKKGKATRGKRNN